jgi:PIN domain nuclease of toxin-antitoxin system
VELLLDTHALIWWLLDEPELSTRAYAAISDKSNAVFVSAASAWEITTKYRLGKLPGAAGFVADIGAALASHGFAAMAVDFQHGQLAGALPGPHKDPFDRMLIVQAMIGNMTLVSNERVFDAFGVKRLW